MPCKRWLCRERLLSHNSFIFVRWLCKAKRLSYNSFILVRWLWWTRLLSHNIFFLVRWLCQTRSLSCNSFILVRWLCSKHIVFFYLGSCRVWLKNHSLASFFLFVLALTVQMRTILYNASLSLKIWRKEDSKILHWGYRAVCWWMINRWMQGSLKTTDVVSYKTVESSIDS